MKSYLILLSTLLTLPSIVAMEVSVQKSQEELNEELFEVVIRYDDATYEEVIELLARGASVHARTPWNATPLIKAAEANNPNACKALLERGASVHAYTEDLLLTRYIVPTLNCTALHFAVEVGNYEVAEILLQFGADVFHAGGTRDNCRTPLHMGENNDLTPLLMNYALSTPEESTFNTWLPENTPDITNSLSIMTMAYWCLKNLGFPRDVIRLILQRNEELRIRLGFLLLPTLLQGKPIKSPYGNTIAQSIKRHTLEKLLPYRNEPIEYLDQQYGDAILNNAMRCIKEPIIVHPSKGSRIQKVRITGLVVLEISLGGILFVLTYHLYKDLKKHSLKEHLLSIAVISALVYAYKKLTPQQFHKLTTIGILGGLVGYKLYTDRKAYLQKLKRLKKRTLAYLSEPLEEN